jgi:hypothetical protein
MEWAGGGYMHSTGFFSSFYMSINSGLGGVQGWAYSRTIGAGFLCGTYYISLGYTAIVILYQVISDGIA